MNKKASDVAASIAMAITAGLFILPVVFALAFAAGMGWTFGQIVWGIV